MQVETDQETRRLVDSLPLKTHKSQMVSSYLSCVCVCVYITPCIMFMLCVTFLMNILRASVQGNNNNSYFVLPQGMEEPMCAVCLETFHNKDTIRVLPCR